MARTPEWDEQDERESPAHADTLPAQSAPEPAPSSAGLVLALQRSAGNSAVTNMLAGGQARPFETPSAPEAAAANASVQRRLARCVQRRALSGGRAGKLILQRSIATSGGDWDTDKYDLLQDVDQAGNAVPAAQGLRGLDMKLKFKPFNFVDAELIGLTQSVQAFVSGTPNLTPAASTRAIPAGDAKAINTGAGETDEGTAIDRAAGYNNPIYPVNDRASGSLADTSTSPGWGQNGWHYKDGAGRDQHQDATLIDKPMRAGAQKDSRHIFETTALATKGVQAGTYYGSVRWGWRTDGTGAFTKIPFEKVSDGVPSSTFLKAAGLWNPGKSSTGAENVDLPIPDVKVTTGPITVLPDRMAVAPAITLPVGSRLQIISPWHPPLLTGTVKVVDGPYTGYTGEVGFEEWSLIVDERA